MSLKDFAKQQLFDFFVITTFVNFAMFVLNSIYLKDAILTPEILLGPPLYGFFGTLPSWILFSKKELSARQYFIRQILQIICLELLLILLTFGNGNLRKENAGMITSFSISVLLIYFCVHLMRFVLDKRQANLLMQDLLDYQKGKES